MRFLFIGDSITVGMRETLGRYMLGLGQTCEIVSRVSMTVREAVDDELVGEALELRRPAVVVVMLGTNPFGIMSADTFREDVRDLLVKIRRVTGKIGWIGSWAGQDVEQRYMILRELVGWKVADGFVMGKGLARSGENQVHFTSEAYPDLAWRVVKWTSRVVEPRILTAPRSTGKMISVLGLGAAAVAPMIPGWWR